jgi:tRNA(fMet)-specific endonuclease VapC
LKYLLDTNVCIALINGRPLSVRTHFDRELSQGSDVYASSVVVFELWYGVSKSHRHEVNAQLLAGFLSGPVHQLAFDEEDARFAGVLRAEMESIGRPVGEYDLLIAGQALRHKMTLVTANGRGFGRIKPLSWEDWSKPQRQLFPQGRQTRKTYA